MLVFVKVGHPGGLFAFGFGVMMRQVRVCPGSGRVSRKGKGRSRPGTRTRPSRRVKLMLGKVFEAHAPGGQREGDPLEGNTAGLYLFSVSIGGCVSAVLRFLSNGHAENFDFLR